MKDFTDHFTKVDTHKKINGSSSLPWEIESLFQVRTPINRESLFYGELL